MARVPGTSQTLIPPCTTQHSSRSRASTVSTEVVTVPGSVAGDSERPGCRVHRVRSNRWKWTTPTPVVSSGVGCQGRFRGSDPLGSPPEAPDSSGGKPLHPPGPSLPTRSVPHPTLTPLPTCSGSLFVSQACCYRPLSSLTPRSCRKGDPDTAPAACVTPEGRCIRTDVRGRKTGLERREVQEARRHRCGGSWSQYFYRKRSRVLRV